MGGNWQVFVDLDGVLADFDLGVRRICGALPDELEPAAMWRAIAHARGFYEHLAWMSDGRALWGKVKEVSPIILTGLPRGNWAEAQKRAWCARELGPDVPVITCLSRNKHLEAKAACAQEQIPVLIDDRYGLKDAWENIGGIFVHHSATVETIARLGELGIL